MSVHSSITSLLSREESRSASTGLLVIGVVLGGSAVSAALWLQSTRALRWPGRRLHRSVASSNSVSGRHVICVFVGLSKSCRSEAIEVATCFGITEVWVVAKAGPADLQDDFKQTHSGSMFSANGLTVTMRIFATAHECCAELIDAGWTICIASSEPSHAGSALLSNKVAIVAAEPSPSTAFLQAAAHEAPAGQGKLPAAAALALTLHHCTANTGAEATDQQQSIRPEAKESLGEQAASSHDSMGSSVKLEEQGTQGSRSKQDAAAASTDSTAASHESSLSLPLKSGAAEVDASQSVDATSATTPAATSGPSSPHASNSQPDDSTPAQPLTGDESAVADVQQADAAYGGTGSQQSRSDQASSPATASWPVDRPAGMSAGGDGNNGEHGDDDSRSVRSQDTTTSRASKIQASEMTRLQAQAMRRSGVMRRHGMGGPGGSRPTSSMGSPTGSVASVSTSGWPETSPYK